MVNCLPLSAVTRDDIRRIAKEKFEAGIKLKDVDAGLWLFGERQHAPDDVISELDWFVSILLDVLGGLPHPAKDFVGPLNPETGRSVLFKPLYDMKGFPRDTTLAAAENRYHYLFVARQALRDIASKWANGNDLAEVVPVAAPPHDEADTPLALASDGQGRITERRSTLLDNLRATLIGVEHARIRQCPICEKIYWAERKDQPTCSKRCNSVRRSRIHRGTYEKSQAN